jgi:hypothetical protein
LVEVSIFRRRKDRSHILLGYSFKTSQYGLALDNVAGYELVLPNGTVMNVTSKDKDLWFGLRVRRQAQYDSIEIGITNGA